MNLIQAEILFGFLIPPFAVALLIGWFLKRKRGKPSWFKIILFSILTGVVIGPPLLVLYVGSVLVSAWDKSESQSMHIKPMSVEEARSQNCPIPLPVSAHSISFAEASGGMQAFEVYVRFEAPADVCRAHAQTVADTWARQDNLPPYVVALSPITSPPELENQSMIGNAAWFDKEKIVHGETGGGGSHQPEFWIDDDRGIFYCRITD